MGSSFVQFDLRFYVVALIFIIFDVEVAFLFPWATVFGKAFHLSQSDAIVAAAGPDGQAAATATVAGIYEELGVRGAAASAVDLQQAAVGGQLLLGLSIAEVLVFFVILLVGFAYVWRMGALDWVRALTAQKAATALSSEEGTSTAEPVLSA